MPSALAPLALNSTLEREAEHTIYSTALRDNQVERRQRTLASACMETSRRPGLEALAGPIKAIAWTA